MKILHIHPPNIKTIMKKFPDVATIPGIVYTYGNTIYNPSGGDLPDHLIHHERIHIIQQKLITPKVWWQQYLDDENFRLEQELEAYRGQYDFIKIHYNREQRRALLDKLATDLSSGMYGKILDKKMAKELIGG